MANKIQEKLRKWSPFGWGSQPEMLPKPLPPNPNQLLVSVFVEGYEDVAFWRGIFDHFLNPHLRFEISVPNRPDLPKGKKVLMSMIPESSSQMLLCMDSDFDYLFDGCTEQSREVNASQYLFHTYAYATENYLCYAPSLHNVCVRATKNDTRIFDFEHFMHEYSCTIYPLFLWYAFSAQRATLNVFPLNDFKASVRVGYLDLEHNGANTIKWLRDKVAKREKLLRTHNPRMVADMEAFEARMTDRGLTPENAYLFMHGHTLMDNVVLILLNAVCEKLRQMSIAKITSSKKTGVALKNEMSNYSNSLRSVREVLLDNDNYTSCPLYKQLRADIQQYLDRAIREMKRSGKIRQTAE